MDSSDLDAEFAAAKAALLHSDRLILLHASVPPIMIAADMVGVASIELLDDGLWEPHPFGERAYITPARVDPESGEHESEPRWTFFGQIIDLIAWHPSTPMAWAARTGAAECLGCFPPQLLTPDRVHVRRSPASWLAGRARGIVPLGSPIDQQALLLRLGSIAAEDHDHALELRRLCERPASIPNIFIAGERDDKRSTLARGTEPIAR
jgi:hypothetical protein